MAESVVRRIHMEMEKQAGEYGNFWKASLHDKRKADGEDDMVHSSGLAGAGLWKIMLAFSL